MSRLAVFGGVLRDIVCNEIPGAFRDHRPYAICAFLGSWILVAAPWLGASGTVAMTMSATAISVLRGMALVTDYRLPEWNSGHRNDP